MPTAKKSAARSQSIGDSRNSAMRVEEAINLLSGLQKTTLEGDTKWVPKLISIKTKIVALISGSLALTLTSYLIAGTSLILRDKTSYLYDNALTEVSGNASVIDAKIDHALLL